MPPPRIRDEFAHAEEDALFGDWPRDDPSEGEAGELMWQFLDRVDDPAFDRVRRLLNAWYSRYPIEHRPKLRGNLAGRSCWRS